MPRQDSPKQAHAANRAIPNRPESAIAAATSVVPGFGAGESVAAGARPVADEPHYRLLFDHHPCPMWICDLETLRFLAVNDAAIARYGHDRERFLGLTLLDIRPPAHAPALLAKVEEQRREAPGLDVAGIWRHRAADGTEFDAEVTTHAVTWEGRRARMGLVVDVTERQQMVAILRESEERFQQLAGALDAVFWLIDPADRRILYVSPAYERLWGLDPARLYADSRVWVEIVHPDDRERSERAFVTAASSGDYDQEYRIVLANGEIRWVRDRGFPVRDAAGTTIRIAGIAEDVTDRKAAEAALREREVRLRLATETGGLGTWDLDLTTGESWASASIQEMFGVASDQGPAPLTSWLSLIAANDRERVQSSLEQAIAAGTSFASEFAVDQTDGSQRIVITSGVVERDDASRPLRVYGVAADVTERRRAEAVLRESEERFRATFEQAAVGLAHVGLDGRILRLNRRLADTLDYPQEALLGRPLADLIVPQDRAVEAVETHRVVSGQVPFSVRQARFLKRQGSSVWVQVTASLARPAETTTEPYLIAVIEDISQRKAAERAQARTQAAIRRQAHLLDQAYDAIFAWDWDGTITYWNRGAERLYGYTPDEAVGKVSHDLLRTRHPASADQMLGALAGDGIWEGDLEHTASDGRLVAVESRQLLVREGGRRYVLEVNRDVTARRAVEREREALVARLAAEEARLRAVLEQLPSGLVIAEAPSGRFLLGNPQVARIWRHPFLDATEVAEYGAYQGFYPGGRRLAPTEWPLARAITTGETVRGEEIEILRGDGSRGTISANAAPIRDEAGAIVAGVVSFDDVTERRQAEAAQRFLAEASAELAASLGDEVILARIARLAVPLLADLCVIDLATVPGELRRVAICHVDPAQEAALREVTERLPASGRSGGDSAHVFASGRPLLLPTIADAHLMEIAHDPQDLVMVRAWGIGSYLSVPLTARGRTFGVLTLATQRETGRPLGAADLAFATELAGRAAIAVDNGRLYAAEQRARAVAEQATIRVSRLQDVTAALAGALTLEDVVAVVVDHGVAALGADAGSLAMVTSDGSLEIVRAIGYPSEQVTPWRRFAIDAPVPLAKAVRTGETIIFEVPDDLAALYPSVTSTPDRPASATLVAVPLLVEGQPIGALGLSFKPRHLFGTEDQGFLVALSRQAAQALERARLYMAERQARQQAEAAEGRLAVLAEASAVLAGSLDIEQTLRRVAELIVPGLADWCAVHLSGPDGQPTQLAVAHTDPGKMAWAKALQERYPPDPTSQQGIIHEIESGTWDPHPVIDDAMLATGAKDEPHRAMPRTSGMSSAMMIPLVSHGQTLGTLSLVRAASGQRYGADDLGLAEDLGRRCAMAVANARLYAAERQARDAARAAEQGARRDAERLTVLARSSATFAEAGLDYKEALNTVARFTADVTGDVCIVRLISEDGAWADVAAVHHPDPALAAAGWDLTTARRQRIDEGFSADVLRSGTALILPRVDPDRLHLAFGSEDWATANRFPVQGLVVVPLRARGGIFGTLALLRLRPTPLFDDEDRGFLQDLADRAALAIENARLYHEAQAAVRARDEFLSIAAHELRTPVTTVKGYAQMLKRAQAKGATEGSRVAKFLQAIDDSADRLGVLTSDLLDVSRIRLGQLPLRPQTLDLAELTRTVVGRAADQLDPASPHRLTFVEGGTPAEVQVDRDRTDQVLTNLIENATKYSPAGGEITITLDPSDGGLLLSVRDRGIGLPPGETESIFEPFHRATNAARDNLPGMGLGLHICRSIAERHGGRIWAESAGEGLGTTMRLWLPRRQATGVRRQDEVAPRP